MSIVNKSEHNALQDAKQPASPHFGTKERGRLELTLVDVANTRVSVLLLAALAFSLPSVMLTGAGASRVRDVVLVVCSLLAIFLSVRERKGWGGSFFIGFGLFAMLSLLSLAWVMKFGIALGRLIDLALAVLMGLAIALCSPTQREIKCILNAFVFGTIIVSVACIRIDWATLSGWARLGRTLFDSAGSNIIEYSCLLIYAQMYAAYRFISSKSRILWCFAFLFLFICGLLTGVRKTLVMPIVFIYVYLLIINRKNVIKILGVTLLAGVACAVIIFIVTNYFTSMGSRLLDMLNDIINGADAVSSGGSSFEERKWLRQVAWQAFRENPVLGLGVGQFRSYSVAHGGPDVYAHNNFLELLANSGIVGFGLYYGAIALMIRDYWRDLAVGDEEHSCFCAFCVAFVVSILVMEYGQVDYYQPHFLLFPFLMSAFVQSPKSWGRAGYFGLGRKERLQ